ncbi:hypothetical protein KR018_001751 [Drosophila ironensis]|nr:hypothetical protein KR018_001751 [Drosophila ironensis]
MALLTGFNMNHFNFRCIENGLDACPFVWKDYKAKGYTTAFAEDWSPHSTFSSDFWMPPTDVYGRPLVLAVEHELKVSEVSELPYCMGRKQAGEYIYDLGVEFSRVNRNRTFFGMFWTNSFSHNNFALPSAMDARMVEYMRTLDKHGVMDNTIIIFLSDHGSRFGPLRRLDSGFMEERLPFLFIRLPRWIREKYPQFVRSLQANRNRLTSPYDIHATLRHILELDTPSEELPRPLDCPGCRSVLEEVPQSRSCAQAGIDDNWCGCFDYQPVNKTLPIAVNISQQIVQAINTFLDRQRGTEKCQKLRLTNIRSIQRRSNSSSYLVQLSVNPGDAFFETTVDWNDRTKQIKLSVPSISRFQFYEAQSKCTPKKENKKFCICRWTRIVSDKNLLPPQDLP